MRYDTITDLISENRTSVSLCLVGPLALPIRARGCQSPLRASPPDRAERSPLSRACSRGSATREKGECPGPRSERSDPQPRYNYKSQCWGKRRRDGEESDFGAYLTVCTLQGLGIYYSLLRHTGVGAASTFAVTTPTTEHI